MLVLFFSFVCRLRRSRNIISVSSYKSIKVVKIVKKITYGEGKFFLINNNWTELKYAKTIRKKMLDKNNYFYTLLFLLCFCLFNFVSQRKIGNFVFKKSTKYCYKINKFCLQPINYTKIAVLLSLYITIYIWI